MASHYLLRKFIEETAWDRQRPQEKLRRRALAQAASQSVVPDVASSSSGAKPTSVQKKKPSGDAHVHKEASPARELVARSLKGTHMPPPKDWQPDSDTDSGDEADDEEEEEEHDPFADPVNEEDPFADFFECNLDDEDAGVQDLKDAMEYLQRVLTTTRARDAAAREDAGHKSSDDKSVQVKDRVVDGEDDFVLIDFDDDDNDDEIQEMRETCADLLNELDYVTFPTVDTLASVRDGEPEVLNSNDSAVNGTGAASSSARVRSKQQLNKRRREVAKACGDLFKDVSRRLHRLKNGC
ncbi:hypothetical protein V8C26DRAFT_430536 [Trichoderma gracile]